MPKYRKKPVEIEAFQVGIHPSPEWFLLAVARSYVQPFSKGFLISTIEGDMTARECDWIIQGVEGELYPCKNSIFQATYEAVDVDG